MAENKMQPQGKPLAEDDLRLVALTLIAAAPCHGYEIVKTVEQKTAGWNSPNPNLLYPILNGLVGARYVTASPDPPRLFTITEEGSAYLEQNRAGAEAVFKRLTALGERIARWRLATEAAQGPAKPRDDIDSAEGLLEILARAANEPEEK